MTSDAEKARLRRAVRASLESVTEEDARGAGRSVAENLERWPGWDAASVVVAYSAIHGELDCGPVIRAVQRAGKKLLLPRMRPGRVLEFAEIRDLGMLRAGRHGILEPVADCPKREIGEGTLLLVPGLAFDRRGGRLGRGGGYYDRALAVLPGSGRRVLRIGVGFDRQIVEAVPMTPLDARMDFIATESGLFAAGSPVAEGAPGSGSPEKPLEDEGRTTEE